MLVQELFAQLSLVFDAHTTLSAVIGSQLIGIVAAAEEAAENPGFGAALSFDHGIEMMDIEPALVHAGVGGTIIMVVRFAESADVSIPLTKNLSYKRKT